MCGIVAIFSPEGTVRADALTAATAMLRHRGPDGQRTWVSADRRAGLGHALLNIAAADGTQPIASEDGQRLLVMNGEFYGHLAIRRELEADGHRFRTETDSEIALHLYEEIGPACLERLRGEFAFVIWDAARQSFFAARDRFGIKPLFCARLGDALLFASEVKALFAAGVPAAWDREAVAHQLFGCFRADRTLFAGVRQVPPGHYLKGTADSPRLVRYWDIGYPRRSEMFRDTEEECVREIRRLLTDAVGVRMRAHVPVGYLLSGGLDSSAVMSIAAVRSDRPVRAFTIAFDGEGYDESAKARLAADHAGAVVQILRVTDGDIADHLAGSVWHGESIQINAHGTARFLLSKAIQAAGYRAVMAGEGADELFAGYGFVRTALLGGNGPGGIRHWGPRLRRLAAPLGEAEREIARVSPLGARLTRAIALPDALVRRFAGAISLWSSVLAPAFSAEIQDRDPYRALLRGIDWRGQVVGREPAKQVLYLWTRSIFAGYHMAADRMDMAHAVEVRLPFLDHELFRYTSQVPVWLLAKEGRNKHLLREAARPFLAEAIANGAKQPFYAPPAARRPGNRLHDLVQDTLRGQGMAVLPFFDQRSAIGLLDRAANSAPHEQAMLDPLLMVMVSLCLLQEQFGPA